MKHIKIICAIAAAALLTGCADEAVSSATTQTTAQTTTTAETTIQTTSVVGSTAWEFSSADLNIVDDKVPPVMPEQEITTTDPVADQIAQEREESVPIISTEEAEQHQQDREDRQEMADNTQNYTTEGIPLTTDGDLAEPAKPTADYKLPEGAQLEFTGDVSTALLTELPEGCYWVPTNKDPNAFMDPAGNRWLNRDPESIPFADRNRDSGYYSPDGDYHPSQYEIDAAIAANQASQERWENGPSGDGMSNMTDQEIADLDAMLGI